MNLTLTPNAVSHIKCFVSKTPALTQGLRIYVEGGGCSGFQYGFKFDAPTGEDFVVNQDEVNVMVDPFSAAYLEAATIDYVESLMNTGFVVHNPNSKSTCGCGMSFSV